MVLTGKNCLVELSFAYAMCVFRACRLPRFGYTLFKIKRRGILYSCLSHLLGSRIALPKDKQRISPRRVYIQILNAGLTTNCIEV